MGRVTSSSSSGTVSIQGTDGGPITATDGAVNVNVVSTAPSLPTETLSIYAEVDGVALGASSIVLSYTVPVDMNLYLNKVLVSSDSIAQFDLEFDGVTNARKRISYTGFNETFDYSLNGEIGGYKVVSGTVITIVGTNQSPNGPASFNVTLQGVQQ